MSRDRVSPQAVLNYLNFKKWVGEILWNSENAHRKSKTTFKHQTIVSLWVIDAKELIFKVILTIRQHWEALESKITKNKNNSKASDNILSKGNRPLRTHFWGHFTVQGHSELSRGAKEQNKGNFLIEPENKEFFDN